MGMHRGTVTKIKNDFDYTFWYDMFIMKGSQTPGLPDRVDRIFKMRRLWYVDIAVQMSELKYTR